MAFVMACSIDRLMRLTACGFISRSLRQARFLCRADQTAALQRIAQALATIFVYEPAGFLSLTGIRVHPQGALDGIDDIDSLPPEVA